MSPTASSSYFVWLNRGKESVVLDLTKADDKALLAAMIAQGRRVRAEPQARRGGEARLSDRTAAARASAPDRLLGLGLRRRRALCRPQGLRPADPGRGRACLDHRRAVGAGARRRLGVRHRRRHERLRGDPRSADRARAHRRGRRAVGVAVRRDGGLDDDPAAAAGGRQAAEAGRPRAHLDRALRRVQEPRRRRHPDLDPERPRVARAGRARCWATRRWPTIRTSPAMSSG